MALALPGGSASLLPFNIHCSFTMIVVIKPVEKTKKNILFWKKLMYFYAAFPAYGQGKGTI